MTIILCAINDETGEVLNRDGSVAGKVVPPNTTPAMVDAYLSANHLYWQAQDCIPRPADKWCNGTPSGATAQSYKAMLAASNIDLSGCEVKVPERERDALRVDDCAWTPDNEDMWNTSCGEVFTFIDAGPEENNAKYCCYCGGKLINTQHAAIDAARAK